MSFTFITVNDFEDTKEWKKFLKGLCKKSNCTGNPEWSYVVKIYNKIHTINRNRFEMIILNHKHIMKLQIPEGSIISDPDIKNMFETEEN